MDGRRLALDCEGYLRAQSSGLAFCNLRTISCIVLTLWRAAHAALGVAKSSLEQACQYLKLDSCERRNMLQVAHISMVLNPQSAVGSMHVPALGQAQ